MGRTSRWIAGSFVVAAASMLVAPTALNFDPWAWLVWGREVVDLDLDTTGGPSWKPFPVLATAPLSLLGDAAPYVWMFLARAGGIGGLVLAGAVAAKLIKDGAYPRWATSVAGVSAAVFLTFSPDVKPRWVRTLAVGHTAALAGGLTLWAIHAHLHGRRRTAWLALVGASLIRPETWPFLLGYGIWLAWTRPTWRVRSGVAAGWAAVPVLWLGGDKLGSGSAVYGADMAQQGPESFVDRMQRVVEVTVGMVPAVVWVMAAVAMVAAIKDRRSPGPHVAVLALATLSAAWIAIVSGLTIVLGYAALSRFLIPASAVVCIIAALGVVHLAQGVRANRWMRPRGLALGALIVVALVPSYSRVTGMITVWDETVERGNVTADLTDAHDTAERVAGGRDAILACGQVTIEHRPLVRPQLAWLLGEPMHRVHTARDPVAPGVMFIARGSAIDRHQTSLPPEQWRELAVNANWRVLAIRCPLLTDLDAS